eukprot:CAMPEP_0168362188 /NCGR_PEP_ID=MMETSP0228-20121227/3049_1 /TAXON_ID=133427 /ORGANISM="Protoceratium reticulatum, Strain CCCM 535 (=CCMP 1889)" /LENGTH=464 /DNA_ID=CAMNT_0008374881 /DNA_START=144 /DNA_END=1538 /DNA_ORIENTATION=-
MPKGLDNNIPQDLDLLNKMGIDVSKYPSAWAASSFRNRAFERKMNNLMDRQRLKITSIGGSASCYEPTYLRRMAARLRKQNVTIQDFNPSQGYTGSTWGALMADSLMPPDSDVVLWEMIINDRKPESTGMNPTEYHKKVFELFVRRVLAVNPQAIIGMVGLWRPGSAACHDEPEFKPQKNNVSILNAWPCAHDSDHFNELLEVVAHYKDVGFFGVDVNKLAQSLGLNRKAVLRDGHHPTPKLHELIGESLFIHTLLPSESYGGPMNNAILQREENTHLTNRVGLSTAVLTEDELKSELLSALWDVQNAVQSLLYAEPQFGIQTVHMEVDNPSSDDVGRASSERNDRKHVIDITKCSDGAIQLNLPSRQHPIHFVGLNLQQGGPLSGPQEPNFGDYVEVRVNKNSIRPITNEEMHGEMHASFLTKGFMEPQAYFATDSTTMQSAPPMISVCAKSERFALGAVVVF